MYFSDSLTCISLIFVNKFVSVSGPRWRKINEAFYYLRVRLYPSLWPSLILMLSFFDFSLFSYFLLRDIQWSVGTSEPSFQESGFILIFSRSPSSRGVYKAIKCILSKIRRPIFKGILWENIFCFSECIQHSFWSIHVNVGKLERLDKVLCCWLTSVLHLIFICNEQWEPVNL